MRFLSFAFTVLRCKPLSIRGHTRPLSYTDWSGEAVSSRQISPAVPMAAGILIRIQRPACVALSQYPRRLTEECKRYVAPFMAVNIAKAGRSFWTWFSRALESLSLHLAVFFWNVLALQPARICRFHWGKVFYPLTGIRWLHPTHLPEFWLLLAFSILFGGVFWENRFYWV